MPQKNKPNTKQLIWLKRGLLQAGGKLPLFDEYGQHYDPKLIKACINHGWAEPWCCNALKPNWLVCKLTTEGREISSKAE